MRRWTMGVALALTVMVVLPVGGYYLMNSRSLQLAGRIVSDLLAR